MHELPPTASPSNITPLRSLKVITRTFGGKPLAILIGHEDFDMVFIVNQVAEVCHIVSPAVDRLESPQADRPTQRSFKGGQK